MRWMSSGMMLMKIQRSTKNGQRVAWQILRREFALGQQVLLFNSRLKLFPSKLRSRWTGPYTIDKVSSFGPIDLKDKAGYIFKVNGQSLKHYYGEQVERNCAFIPLGDPNWWRVQSLAVDYKTSAYGRQPIKLSFILLFLFIFYFFYLNNLDFDAGLFCRNKELKTTN